MSADDWTRIVLGIFDIIKVAIWPLTALYIVLKFKAQIKVLILRIVKIPTPFGSFEAQNQEQDQENKEEIRDTLAEEIKNQKVIQNKLLELQENTKKNADLNFLLYHFERTYRLIFSSQLEILDLLSKNGSLLLSLLIMKYRTTNWYPSYPFENYIGFLVTSGLVVFDAKSGNSYSISPLGNLFLKYLRDNNIPLEKIPY